MQEYSCIGHYQFTCNIYLRSSFSLFSPSSSLPQQPSSCITIHFSPVSISASLLPSSPFPFSSLLPFLHLLCFHGSSHYPPTPLSPAYVIGPHFHHPIRKPILRIDSSHDILPANFRFTVFLHSHFFPVLCTFPKKKGPQAAPNKKVQNSQSLNHHR